MSDLTQAVLISGGIFALVMARGYGRRAFGLQAVLLPVVMIGGFGYAYLRHAPLHTPDLAAYGVDLDWYTTRERSYEEVLPWDHLDSGLDKDWLWEDWQDALDETEVEDCRWTPCFDCGVCPQMDTHIQIGPTGKKLLPLTVK